MSLVTAPFLKRLSVMLWIVYSLHNRAARETRHDSTDVSDTNDRAVMLMLVQLLQLLGLNCATHRANYITHAQLPLSLCAHCHSL
jgi:hypothetical protein